MPTFKQIYELSNLRRAYRWVLSNPEPAFKNYFRDAYSDYALSSETNLKFLRRQISQHRYTPTHASKLYVPKTSGILRPISLLTVNDQIAYQAIINLVAEALFPKVKNRYRKSVFQHLYAGKSSPFFYLRWQDSYKIFGNAVRRNFADGHRFVATFDLTAFYDSIDHHVLGTFLKKLSFDDETVGFLLRCLHAWTSATWASSKSAIYIRHGIPQGPIASGMLSEVVLQYLDTTGTRASAEVRYLRYVDDIKLMAKTEEALRRRLLLLDLASKEVGLFPQVAKVAIREINDPESEIKSVSRPPETSTGPFGNQALVRARVRELGNRGKPKDLTRFRFVLASLKPTAKSNDLLFKVLANNPHLVESITRHWSSYPRLPKRLAYKLLIFVTSSETYHHVSAQILELLYQRVRSSEAQQIADFCYERLFAGRYRRKSIPQPQPTYKAALAKWALHSGRMTYMDFESLMRSERDWWVRQAAIRGVDVSRFGPGSYEALLNLLIREDDPELARASAALIFSTRLSIHRPYGNAHFSARLLLKSVKLIPSAGRAPSLIGDILAYVLRRPKTLYDWQRYFGADHSTAEQMLIVAKQRFETDIDAFIVVLDSFCDSVIRAAFTHQGSTMTANYGSVVGGSGPAWLRAMSRLVAGLHKLHQLRIRSYTAHPRHRTGERNRRLRHTDYNRIRKEIVSAFDELEANIAP